jgi:RHS repeat-associated protein
MAGTLYDEGVRSRCTGKERDDETGMDYFGARYYDSSRGRFLTPDWAASPSPVPYANFSDPQTINQYSYVRNNPLALADEDGHDAVGNLGAGQETIVGPTGAAGAGDSGQAKKINQAQQAAAAGITASPTAMEEIDAVVKPLIESAGGALSKAGTTLLDIGATVLLTVTYLASPGTTASEQQDTIKGHENSSSPEPAPAAGGAGARGRDPNRFFSRRDKQELANEASKKCQICGGSTTPAQKSQRGVTPPRSEAQTDHKVAWSKGGRTVKPNGQHVCRGCNIDKSNE